MPSSTCTFTNARDQELSARIEEPEGTVRATALFAHCFTCSKDLRAARRLTRALATRGIATLSFDFAGLGSSDGDFAASTFSHDVADLVAAADYLGETIMPPSLLVGHSLGGAAVLTAASRLDSVVAVATAGAPADVAHVTALFEADLATIRDRGEAQVQLAGRPFTIRSSFVEDLAEQRLLETVADLDAALLFLHAPLDNTVGIENAAELFTAARHPKSFVSLDDADHLLTDDRDARYVAEVIAGWASRYLPEVADTGPATADAVSATDGTYDDAVARATTGADFAADVAVRGFRVRVGEPADAGGDESGPTPYDYLDAALGSCTSLTLRLYADRKGYALDEVRVDVTNDRRHAKDCEECEHESGRIHVFDRTIHLTGDLTDEQRDDLVRIADRCPVHKTLEGQIEVHTTVG